MIAEVHEHYRNARRMDGDGNAMACSTLERPPILDKYDFVFGNAAHKTSRSTRPEFACVGDMPPLTGMAAARQEGAKWHGARQAAALER